MFSCHDQSVQNTVCVSDTVFEDEPGNDSNETRIVRKYVRAACLNMHKPQPSEIHRFSSAAATLPADLNRLLEYINSNHNLSDRVIQFAVWTLTDNPLSREHFTKISRQDEYGRVSIVPRFEGPSLSEFSEIRAILQGAGINVWKYWAFGPVSSQRF